MAIGFVVMIASVIFGVVTPSAATIADCPETECITVVAPRLPADFGYGIDLFTAPSIDLEFNIAPPEVLPPAGVTEHLTDDEILECAGSLTSANSSAAQWVDAFNVCARLEFGRTVRQALCDAANPVTEGVLLGGIVAADRRGDLRTRAVLAAAEAGLWAISSLCWLGSLLGPGPGREIP